MPAPGSKPAVPGSGSRMDRCGGSTLPETLVVLVLVGMLVSVVMSALYASARLVATTNTDSDPTVFGTLATSVARLEDSVVAAQRCTNPPRERMRSRCVQVQTLGVPRQDPGSPTDPNDDFAGYPHPDGRPPTPREACWVVADPAVASGDQRRLECWEVTEPGVVTASIHTHAELDSGGSLLADTSDLLAVTEWQPGPAVSRPVGFGVRALAWDAPNQSVAICAAVRPQQRAQMRDSVVPFCDGTTGLVAAAGTPRGPEDLDDWSTIEGILLPPLRFTPGALR